MPVIPGLTSTRLPLTVLASLLFVAGQSPVSVLCGQSSEKPTFKVLVTVFVGAGDRLGTLLMKNNVLVFPFLRCTQQQTHSFPFWENMKIKQPSESSRKRNLFSVEWDSESVGYLF